MDILALALPARVSVRAQDFTAGFRGTPYFVRSLAQAGKCRAKLNRRGELQYIQLVGVSIRTAEAWLNRLYDPESKQGITRMRQSPGAAYWVQRVDRARRGAGRQLRLQTAVTGTSNILRIAEIREIQRLEKLAAA